VLCRIRKEGQRAESKEGLGACNVRTDRIRRYIVPSWLHCSQDDLFRNQSTHRIPQQLDFLSHTKL